MHNELDKNYLKWFAKAEEDELSIRAVLKEGAPSTGCFLSQQMAEKYLKGMLVFHQIDFPKVHDLLDLETLLLDNEPKIVELHPALQTLNRYYETVEECKSQTAYSLENTFATAGRRITYGLPSCLR